MSISFEIWDFSAEKCGCLILCVCFLSKAMLEIRWFDTTTDGFVVTCIDGTWIYYTWQCRDMTRENMFRIYYKCIHTCVVYSCPIYACLDSCRIMFRQSHHERTCSDNPICSIFMSHLCMPRFVSHHQASFLFIRLSCLYVIPWYHVYIVDLHMLFP